jgi:hypothetical protein
VSHAARTRSAGTRSARTIARRSARFACAGAVALVAMVTLGGCDRGPSSPPPAVVRDLEQGQLRVRVTLDRDQITTAQRARLTIATTMPDGFDAAAIDLPKSLPEGLSLGPSLPETRPKPGAAAAGALQREFLIEPFLSGEYTIAPIEIAATRRGSSPPETLSVRTEPIVLRVASVLKEGETELADVKGVVDVAEPPNWWLIGAAAVGVLALGALGYRAWRRRGIVPPAPPVLVAAHDLALRRLDELMARRLVEAGKFEPFYAEASGILRRYIEDRFGLRAPERTTEEFLEESRTSAVLMEGDVRVLERFMSHVDLVKFAAVVPTEREAQSVASTVREFVDRTRSADRLVELRPDGTTAPAPEPATPATEGRAP